MRTPGTLTDFLGHVAAAYPLFRDADAVRRIASEAVEDAVADGAVFVELRLGPGTHARDGFTAADVLRAAGDGAVAAAGAAGIEVGVVACLLRHHPDELNRQVVDAACRLAGSGVTGIDVAGDELLFPDLARFAPDFARARASGLGLTAHAAEAGPAHAARDAVELLGVSRIGHGSHVADDAGVLGWAADTGVCFEVCPTSNVLTGAALSLATHPVTRFLAAGCRVVLGDDDPITTGARLSQEVRALTDAGVVSGAVLDRIAETSVDVALCDDGTRDRLRRMHQASTVSP